MVTRQYRRAVTIAAIAALSGCATQGPTAPAATSLPSSGDPATTVEAPAPLPTPGAVAPPPEVAAPAGPVAHLLGEAQRLSARREFDRASAQIERALRIEPSSPWLYLALADIRLAQRDFEQASVLVQKARSLSRGDPRVLAESDALDLRNPAPPGPP